ncbi:putative RNA-directed DNA polymerase from transposon BS [Labeo rohita]|uniref:RNA-directed DNA polymerase from transposon BS n=1 Tax=Labeo rohita TaxID=84645 RepID=A0ABQ8LU22_LABRO|nr:putative RNA-directed DNA polymerase from transposon BS [Labeo rohita]
MLYPKYNTGFTKGLLLKDGAVTSLFGPACSSEPLTSWARVKVERKRCSCTQKPCRFHEHGASLQAVKEEGEDAGAVCSPLLHSTQDLTSFNDKCLQLAVQLIGYGFSKFCLNPQCSHLLLVLLVSFSSVALRMTSWCRAPLLLCILPMWLADSNKCGARLLKNLDSCVGPAISTEALGESLFTPGLVTPSLLYETWHQPEVFSVLNETCPPGYCYIQKAHSTGRGGGLAVIYRSHLDLSPLVLPELSSFECLAFNSPWFTSDLRKMKASGRALERRYNASGLTVHKLAYRDHQKAYLKSIKEARSQYNSNSGISRLLGCFPEVTQQEVENIIRGMKSSTCALDPFPTSLVLEKVVASHLQDHLKHNDIFEKFQSGFRSAHSTETALVRVTNDLLITAAAGSPSLLVLLDLSAAFDTVDHDRSEFVAMGSSRSCSHAVGCGVPQGSVLEPILFILYMLPLGEVISRFGISFDCYDADDTQLYMKIDTRSSSLSPSSLSSTTLSTFTACLEEIGTWMNDNFLQLNSSKTEAILIGSPHQIRTSTITCITFSGQDISLSTLVTNLGVKFDPHLTFEAHIKHLCKTSFHHHRNIARLRPTLTLHDAEKLVHAFVSSRLDYCNALLIGIPSKSIAKLQHIQNSAARILMRVRKYEHITPILQSLHWLPISARIEYKVSLLTHQCIHGNAPIYLEELLNLQISARSLRSTNTYRLLPRMTKTRTIGDRAFCAAAPRLRNALPEYLRALQTTDRRQQPRCSFTARRVPCERTLTVMGVPCLNFAAR